MIPRPEALIARVLPGRVEEEQIPLGIHLNIANDDRAVTDALAGDPIGQMPPPLLPAVVQIKHLSRSGEVRLEQSRCQRLVVADPYQHPSYPAPIDLDLPFSFDRQISTGIHAQ